MTKFFGWQALDILDKSLDILSLFQAGLRNKKQLLSDMEKIKLFHTVAIINPVPLDRLTLVEPDYISMQNLPARQVSTVVEVYEGVEDCQYLVEFADTQGREYAMTKFKRRCTFSFTL